MIGRLRADDYDEKKAPDAGKKGFVWFMGSAERPCVYLKAESLDDGKTPWTESHEVPQNPRLDFASIFNTTFGPSSSVVVCPHNEIAYGGHCIAAHRSRVTFKQRHSVGMDPAVVHG